MKTISAIARYLAGVIFLVFGLNGFLHFIPRVVEQIGSDVAAYVPGDAVFSANGMGGAYAEYLAVKAPKLRGRESSPTVTWKRDKRS